MNGTSDSALVYLSDAVEAALAEIASHQSGLQQRE
jgi:hypothetical protein